MNYFLFAFIGLCCASQMDAQDDLSGHSEDLQKRIESLQIVDHFGMEDGEMTFVDDKRFSNRTTAFVVNDNEFVKSDIGIDSIQTRESLNDEKDYPVVIRNVNSHGDSLVVLAPPSESSPLYINGVRYTSLTRATVSGNPRLLTIPEICGRYTDAPMSKTVVSINGLTLLKDVDSYKMAERYILRVDVVSSGDIENCEGNFVLVKIYTRTPMNVKRNIMRLGEF